MIETRRNVLLPPAKWMIHMLGPPLRIQNLCTGLFFTRMLVILDYYQEFLKGGGTHPSSLNLDPKYHQHWGYFFGLQVKNSFSIERVAMKLSTRRGNSNRWLCTIKPLLYKLCCGHWVSSMEKILQILKFGWPSISYVSHHLFCSLLSFETTWCYILGELIHCKLIWILKSFK